MHYYPHHIGDYQRDTAHLSLTEHGAYRLLMDAYYASEKGLPSDRTVLFRMIRAVSKVERDAVSAVIREFFQDDGIILLHKRVESELNTYRVQREQASRAGKASALKRQSVTNIQRPFNARSTPVEFPLERNGNGDVNGTATNQEPRAKSQIIPSASAPPPPGDGSHSKPQTPKPSKPQPVADPRHTEFVRIFTEEYQEATGRPYAMQGGKDGQQLQNLLRTLKDLDAEEWRQGLRWSWKVSTSDQYANACVRQTGSLAAFCTAWSRIVAYHATYQPSNR